MHGNCKVMPALFLPESLALPCSPVCHTPQLDELAIESGAEDWKEVDSLDDRGGKDIEVCS